MPERWILIPRWDDFQHRDMARSTIPPWIKNYTRLLSDDAYLDLTLAQRGLLHGLWMIYASHRRVLNESATSRLLVANKSDAKYFTRNLEALNHAGFIQFSASKPASRNASGTASLEVEVEEELSKAVPVTSYAPPPATEPDAPPGTTERPEDFTHISTIIEASLKEAAAA